MQAQPRDSCPAEPVLRQPHCHSTPSSSRSKFCIEAVVEKEKKAKFYHDRQAKQLLELEIGQEDRMITIDYAEITRGNVVPASRRIVRHTIR